MFVSCLRGWHVKAEDDPFTASYPWSERLRADVPGVPGDGSVEQRVTVELQRNYGGLRLRGLLGARYVPTSSKRNRVEVLVNRTEFGEGEPTLPGVGTETYLPGIVVEFAPYVLGSTLLCARRTGVMFVSLLFRLCRFRPKELERRSVESLLDSVPLRSDEAEFAAVLSAGTLFDLAYEWEVVHAALTGGSQDTRDAGYQPVLGGGMLGRTETEVLVALGPAQVGDVARYLSGLDPQRQVNDNLTAMEAAHGGVIGDTFARYVTDVLRRLTSFYARAAADGDAVVKIVYS